MTTKQAEKAFDADEVVLAMIAHLPWVAAVADEFIGRPTTGTIVRSMKDQIGKIVLIPLDV